MKQNWKIKKLGEVCEFTRGLTYSKNDEVVFSDNIVLRSNNIDLDSNSLDLSELKYIKSDIVIPNDKRIEKDSLIICTANGSKAHLGKVALINIEDNFAFGGFMGKIKPSESIYAKYLYYSMISPDYKKFISKLSDGANINNLKFKDLSLFSIPLPPLADQRRIVAILDAKFAKIDALRAAAQKNLDNAEQLWKAQLEKEFGNKEWKMMKLGEVCEITSKLVNPTEPQYLNLYHVGGANIEAETGVIIDLKTSKEEGLSSGKFTFDNTMVLYNKIRPYLKKVARPTFSGLCSADMYPLYPNKNITKDFLFYVLMSDSFTDYAIKHSGRAGMPKVNRETLFAYNVAIPSLAEQTAIVSRLDALSAQISELKTKYRRQIECCDELRQSLLREAFEGEM